MGKRLAVKFIGCRALPLPASHSGPAYRHHPACAWALHCTLDCSCHCSHLVSFFFSNLSSLCHAETILLTTGRVWADGAGTDGCATPLGSGPRMVLGCISPTGAAHPWAALLQGMMCQPAPWLPMQLGIAMPASAPAARWGPLERPVGRVEQQPPRSFRVRHRETRSALRNHALYIIFVTSTNEAAASRQPPVPGASGLGPPASSLLARPPHPPHPTHPPPPPHPTHPPHPPRPPRPPPKVACCVWPALSSADWQLVPTPCAVLGAALPVVACRSRAEAGQLVRRLPPAGRQRLRGLCPVPLLLPACICVCCHPGACGEIRAVQSFLKHRECVVGPAAGGTCWAHRAMAVWAGRGLLGPCQAGLFCAAEHPSCPHRRRDRSLEAPQRPQGCHCRAGPARASVACELALPDLPGDGPSGSRSSTCRGTHRTKAWARGACTSVVPALAVQQAVPPPLMPV